MTRQEHLLVITMEECDETSQRASKALRFGLEEVQKGQDLNNAMRLIQEFNDLYAMMIMLYQEGMIPHVLDNSLIEKKKENVEKWLLHSEQEGRLS